MIQAAEQVMEGGKSPGPFSGEKLKKLLLFVIGLC